MQRLTRLAAAMLVFALAGCGTDPAPANQTEPRSSATSSVALRSPSIVLPEPGRSGSNVVRLEIARDDEARARGLMFREYLPHGQGMLFIFEETGRYPFWMKNTRIPLDMVWIDAAFNVVHVKANVPPCESDPCPSYDPGVDARYVLELPAGDAAVYGVRDGIRVELRDVNVADDQS